MSGLNVGVLGATGAVGRVISSLLIERNYPIKDLVLMASERSAGKELAIAGQNFTVKAAKPDLFSELDLVLFSPGSKVSSYYAPEAVQRGAVVIDNSSAFRMEDGVPLVVPEVNKEDLRSQQGIIANPNCSTIQMVLALNPIRLSFGLERVIVTTFQSVSGSGQKGIEELQKQAKAFITGGQMANDIYPHQIAFNLIPQIGDFLKNGYTEEEMKMVNETRKLYQQPELPVHATTVRVPVFQCHSESVYFETSRKIEKEELVDLYGQCSGLKYYPRPEQYPVPLQKINDGDTHVGRFKEDLTRERAYSFWVVADNLWKGAALNAVQIAESLLEMGLI
ncbi:MAG: aspartate-semialdehyde dehydrogenase [Halanaerobium sp.]|nr:aspartate-semialdehyde dehydrogenase [Halanaerobium sp.]